MLNVRTILAVFSLIMAPSVCNAKYDTNTYVYNDIIQVQQPFTDRSAYLEFLSDHMKGSNRNTYTHQRPDWATTFAKKYVENGYSANNKPPISVHDPIPWGKIIDGDKNYSYKLNAMYMAEPFVVAYIQTRKEEYFDIALNIHKDWINQNINNDISNKYKWYDMSTGLRTVQLSFIVSELIAKKRHPKEVYPLLKALKIHTEVLANPENLGVMNHVMFQMAGIYATCNLIPFFKECDAWLSYADRQFTKSITDQYNSEGIHQEHSPTYHTWGLEKVASLLKTGWFPERIEDLVAKAKDNIIWMYHPNGLMLNIGHSEQIDMDRYSPYSPYVAYVLSEGKEGTKPLFNSKGFSKAGYGLIRSPWSERPFKDHSYLFLNAGYHTTSHKTNDDLSFEWSELGSVLLLNSGKYAYDRSKRRRYFESFRGNNTVEIKGRISRITKENAYGSALKDVIYNPESKLGFMRAAYKRRENNVLHERILSQRQKHWLIVQDVIGTPSAKAETYVQWFHLAPSAVLVDQSKYKATFFIPEINRHLTVLDLTSSALISIKKGLEDKEIQGWYSRKLWEFKPNYAIGMTVKARKHHFKTLFLLHKEKKTPAIKTRQDKYFNQYCLQIGNNIEGYQLSNGSLSECNQTLSTNHTTQ